MTKKQAIEQFLTSDLRTNQTIIKFDNGDYDCIPRSYINDISWSDRNKEFHILCSQSDYENLEHDIFYSENLKNSYYLIADNIE